MMRVDTPKRAKKRDQGWGAINALIAYIATTCLIRYGLHWAYHPIAIAIGSALPGIYKAWKYRKGQRGTSETDADHQDPTPEYIKEVMKLHGHAPWLMCNYEAECLLSRGWAEKVTGPNDLD